MKIKANIVVLLISLILFVLTSYMITQTYALFETNGSADSQLEIGKWEIKINDHDISLDEKITLDDFIYVNGEHTQDNFFAPGSSLIFDIVIDASTTDVSVLYNLTIDDTAIQEHPNITFKIENIDTDEVIDGTDFEGIIRLNDEKRITTVRVTLNWENVLEYDEIDTDLIDGELEFDMNVNFEQYIE